MNRMKIFWFVCVLTIFMIFSSFYSVSFAQENISDVYIKDQDFIVKEFVSGLKFPVLIDFIEKDMIIIEKGGKVKIVKDGILQEKPIHEFEVSKTIEEGLIGVLVKENEIFFHYTTRDIEDKTTSNWFEKYFWDGERVLDPIQLVSFHGGDGMHNSGVMILDKENRVFATIGDSASSEINHLGMIFELEGDKQIFAKGIRNSYGLDIDPQTGLLWNTENGPESYDEINLVENKFYSGWDYVQGPSFEKKKPEMEGYVYSEPEFSWKKPTGVTAIHFMESDVFPKYHDSVLVGSVNEGIIYKFTLNDKRDSFVFETEGLKDLVLDENDEIEEIFFASGFSGVTDIKQGPNGSIYVVSVGDGKVYEISKNTELKSESNNCDILNEDEFIECDFSNSEITDMQLQGKKFYFTNFSNSKINNVDFSESNFIGSDFSNSEIDSSNFSKTVIESVNIDNSIIKNSNFIDAEIKNIKIKESNLENNNFEQLIIKQTNMDDSKIINNNFQNSNFSHVSSRNTTIITNNFSGSSILFSFYENSIIKNSNLEETQIWKTNLEGSLIEKSSLRNTDLFQSNFIETKLSDVNLQQSRISTTDFSRAEFSQVNIQGVYPIESNFTSAVFEESKINTCLEHDIFSRFLNKIIRTLDEFNIKDSGNIISNFCNQF